MTIDIITITYNNLNGLKKTYNSIKNQTNFNWIVIDGQSVDSTVEFLKEIKEANTFSFEYLSESDNGIYDAMNKGLDKSNGDYVIFLNAGDEFYSDTILLDIFSKINNNYLLIYGNYYRELKNGELTLIKAKSIKYIYHSLPTSHQAIFYRRDAINDLRYNLYYQVSSDYDFTSRFINHNKIITNSNYFIYKQPISIFEYNGLSRNNLSLLYKDAFHIQKNVFNINIIIRLLSYSFKYIRNKFL